MLIALPLLVCFVESAETTCNKDISQIESVDCKHQDLPCRSKRYITKLSYLHLGSCDEFKIKLSVAEPKYSEFEFTISNKRISANTIEILNSDFSPYRLDDISNRTFSIINSNQAILRVRHNQKFPKFEALFSRNKIDDNLEFGLDWKPVLKTQCPDECKNSCCHKSNFKCYSESDICDGEWTCPVGEDEIACPVCGNDPDQIRCPGDLKMEDSDLKCIPQKYLCDGVKDCVCSDPERGCSPFADGYEETRCPSCRPGAFYCEKSNQCIMEKSRCNLHNDCPLGEDEQNCPIQDKRKVLTAAIVGSLGCGVLFVIALGCTRRLFHVQSTSSCSRARRNLQNLANILQVREAPPTYEAAMGIESFGTRQTRSRPWRLTRQGLRRDSRRRRRRVQDGDNQEEASVAEAPPSNFTERIIVTEQIGDSMDSLDSVQPETTEPEVEPTDSPSSQPEEQVVSSAPAAFNIANSPLDVTQTIEAEEETEDRKSISSNIN